MNFYCSQQHPLSICYWKTFVTHVPVFKSNTYERPQLNNKHLKVLSTYNDHSDSNSQVTRLQRALHCFKCRLGRHNIRHSAGDPVINVCRLIGVHLPPVLFENVVDVRLVVDSGRPECDRKCKSCLCRDIGAYLSASKIAGPWKGAPTAASHKAEFDQWSARSEGRTSERPN